MRTRWGLSFNPGPFETPRGSTNVQTNVRTVVADLALELRRALAAAIPDMKDLDDLLQVVDLEVHVAPRLWH